MSSCPCGKTAGKRALRYELCCGRYIDDFEHSPAPDAESLMRSRYTAFVLSRREYLLATWHPDTRPATLELEEDVKWLGLTIREVVPPQNPDTGPAWVEFVARSRLAGEGQRLEERSRFLRSQGRWYYVNAAEN